LIIASVSIAASSDPMVLDDRVEKSGGFDVPPNENNHTHSLSAATEHDEDRPRSSSHAAAGHDFVKQSM
jgi:hypothetical protein